MLVLPHREEILNITALEAAWCGAPMIAAPGGPRQDYYPPDADLLEKRDTFIAPPLNSRYAVFDTEELASRILRKRAELNPGAPRRRNPAYEPFAYPAIVPRWIATLSG